MCVWKTVYNNVIPVPADRKKYMFAYKCIKKIQNMYASNVSLIFFFLTSFVGVLVIDSLAVHPDKIRIASGQVAGHERKEGKVRW